MLEAFGPDSGILCAREAVGIWLVGEHDTQFQINLAGCSLVDERLQVAT